MNSRLRLGPPKQRFAQISGSRIMPMRCPCGEKTWTPSYSGPPRRYYRITDEGRAVLLRWLEIWRDMRDFVDRFAPPASRNGAPKP